MSLDKIITVLGGDKRQAALANLLVSADLPVRSYGLPPELLSPAVCRYQDWRNALKGTRLLVLPLPALADGVHVSMPLCPSCEAPRGQELLFAIDKEACITGGRLPADFLLTATEGERRVFDYFSAEELQLKNAVPTAEGAVSILMRETERTIFGMPVAVVGFGRVARALVKILLALGAEVTVAARARDALVEAELLGCRTLSLSRPDTIGKVFAGQVAIFNTVPARLFTAGVLSLMPREVLLVDLASAPGGVDAEAAAKQHTRVIFALSLPGKYAPESAGEYIAEAILFHYRKEGVL